MLEVRRARSDELSTCLAIRRVVFIEEQRVPEADDVDGLDQECIHALALFGGEPVGTARLRLVDGHAKIERVAVLSSFRGRALGAALMREIESIAQELGHDEAILGAQVQVIPFYEKHGWIAEGPVFMDAGIPHRMMRKRL